MASYSHTNPNQINHNHDNVYYDAVLRNYSSGENEDSTIELNFREVRDVPILQNASDYRMSIIRFQTDSWNLPCLTFQAVRNQPDRDLGIYTVTLEWDDGVGGITATQPENLIWIPQKADVPLPKPPSLTGTTFQEQSPYYDCLDYSYFIRILNTALSEAMIKLRAVIAPTLNTVEEPFFVWNDDQTATVYARESHYNSSAPAHVNIYMNRSLYSLFSSFTFLKRGITATKKRYWQLILDRFAGEKVTTLPNFGIDQLIFSKQEYSTINSWSPISSVLFVTSTIPIGGSQLSTPTIYVDGVVQGLGKTYNNFSNIITDIQSDELSFKPSLLYLPSAQYRYIDLTNDQPLNQIDFSVYWKDKLGLLHAFTIPPNSSCSIKFLFEKIKKSER